MLAILAIVATAGGFVPAAAPASTTATPTATPTPTATASTTPSTTTGAPESFEALLEALSRMSGFEAGFREEKTIALLAEPLESEGRLYFQPPDRLLRRTTAPRASDVLVTRERVVLVDGASATTIDLASQEQIRPLVESILWLFAGDREALERSYAVDYRRGTATETGWTLSLRPRRSPLDLLIRELRISGEGLEARRFEVVEATGDRSVTSLFEADAERVFSAEERRQLFEAPAP